MLVVDLGSNVEACRGRFGLKNVTLVFDRGIVSDENLDEIDEQGLKYVSALDKDQIAGIGAIDWDVLTGISWDNFKERLHAWDCYDESLYFEDLGLYEGRRYILGFNPQRCRDERMSRQEKMAAFDAFLLAKNRDLSEAVRSRKFEKTKQAVIHELKRLKIKKYFHDPVLTEIIRERTNKQGKVISIQSFQASIQKKSDQIALAERLDGLCVFVSNHIDAHDKTFVFSGQQIICAYRDKTKIEDAFKHIKFFLKIRPFYVYREAHVRAVYSICVLAYFLNKNLAERRKKIDGVDYLNSKNLYEPFRNGDMVTLKDRLTGKTTRKPVEMNFKQKELLNKLAIKMPKMKM
jgi:transposase